jgi:hypothetical protein
MSRNGILLLRMYMPKKREKTERIVLQVDPKFKKAIEDYSVESGVPMSEFIRRAIVVALKQVRS